MDEDQIKRVMENVNKITKLTNRLSVNMNQSIQNMMSSIKPVIDTIKNIVTTDYMKHFSSALNNFAKELEKAKTNPNSYFNYIKYQKDLDNLHWSWPYEIEAKELKILLENAHNEKEFDKLMIKFFTKEKTKKMISEMISILPNRHKIMLKQVEKAYDNGDYAIANNALISIIDNMLAEFVINKGQNKRVGILQPIIEYYEDFSLNEVDFIFELCMLSNNINFIFQDYHFNEKIEINTNKIVRRHPSIYGVKYSNKKVDTLLLLNTLMSLLKQQSILEDFKNSLEINKKSKQFVFSQEAKKKLCEKKCIDIIIMILQIEEIADHKTLLKYIEHDIPEGTVDKKKYLSILLQKIKRKDDSIVCSKINGKQYWRIEHIENKV